MFRSEVVEMEIEKVFQQQQELLAQLIQMATEQTAKINAI